MGQKADAMEPVPTMVLSFTFPALGLRKCMAGV